jgi:hypothetical protein
MKSASDPPGTKHVDTELLTNVNTVTSVYLFGVCCIDGQNNTTLMPFKSLKFWMVINFKKLYHIVCYNK